MSHTSPTVGTETIPETRLRHRLAVLAGVIALTLLAYLLRNIIGPRGQALFGIPAFIGFACVFSTNIWAISRRTVISGLLLQLVIGMLILNVPLVYEGFRAIGDIISTFLEFTESGARFVFGPLADPVPIPADGYGAMGGGAAHHFASHRLSGRPFIFALEVLPAVIFVSSFFTVLYHLGVLQFVVKIFAKIVVWIMGTSGAETLSAVANVFMGQTEAPLIVKPYIKDMTKSELLTLMVGGMATISGGVLVAFIGMMNSVGFAQGAVMVLTTSVMAAPAGLYLAKILQPETEVPKTKGDVTIVLEKPDANVFDAASRGASEGMQLVINIIAMLIAFIAFIALFNHLIGKVIPGGSLQAGLAYLFAPVAMLMGVPMDDVPKVGELLGIKLVLNEFVAFSFLVNDLNGMSPRAVTLSIFALTGFANFASIGIQLGGIGVMAPERRGDLAQLGLRALIGGFLATLVNAAVAGVLMS